MKKVKILSLSKCQEMLDFKGNNSLRNKYNEDQFEFVTADFIKGVIDIKIENESLVLGTKPSDDFESSKTIYSALRHLDLVQANDKRLWVSLTHGLFFKYTKQRWGITENTSDEVIKDRFHFEGVGLRARNQNSIARLWWAAKITYDESNLEDPYRLTKLLWEKQDLYQNLIDRKLSIYPGALKAFLRFYEKNRDIDIKKDLRRLFKGINAMGGVRVLAMYNEEMLMKEIEKLCDYYKISFNN